MKQVDGVNPKINAIVTLVAEQAVENARRADEMQAGGAALGPLHGLPVVHKDLFETKGIRTTFGSRIFKDNIPNRDAIIVQRINGAGAICVGNSNTPEFSTGSQTSNAVFGSTKNPYDLTKTWGGSSGGAAVSLTCGMVPIADGSDGGGSLRNPATFFLQCSRTPRCARPGSHSSLGKCVADHRRSRAYGPDGFRRSPSARRHCWPRPALSDLHQRAWRAFAGKLDRSFKGVRVA